MKQIFKRINNTDTESKPINPISGGDFSMKNES